MVINEQRTDRVDVAAPVVLKAHHEIEPPLAQSTPEASCPTSPMRTARITSPGAARLWRWPPRSTVIRNWGSRRGLGSQV